jgi:hypothetical protein
MKFIQPILGACCVAATVLLSACGGGSVASVAAGAAAVVDTPASGETIDSINSILGAASSPDRPPVNAATFVELATNPTCTDARNRFFVIDDKFVFQDSAGNCADASYSRTLFGATPQEVLCGHADSIAGPVTNCSDNGYRALFDALERNRNRPNLGLSASHQVRPLPAGEALAYRVVDAASNAGFNAANTMTVTDSNAWATLWATHTANLSPVPALPTIDFSQKIVLGIYLGLRINGCFGVTDVSVVRRGNRLKVFYSAVPPVPDAVCIQSFPAPGLLLEIDRTDAAVQFTSDPFEF